MYEFCAVDDPLVKWLHETGGVWLQMPQVYMPYIKNFCHCVCAVLVPSPSLVCSPFQDNALVSWTLSNSAVCTC
jgi:hypothetical protein